MPDRKEVIQGLQGVNTYLKSKAVEASAEKNDTLRECLIESQTIINDAIALLKEQKHGETFTVIDTKTGKEADEYNIALYEEWAQRLCYCDMEGWAIENDGTLLLVDECGRFEYADRKRFKVVWDA